ncbi:hypothetical protein ACP70R_025282 [Stipagrostis hirtigluma subsp. patula]
MGELGDKTDYESLREARISENKARMEMLGLRRAKKELADMISASTPARRPWTHKQYAIGPPRRSPRLNKQPVQHKALPLAGCLGKVIAMPVEGSEKLEKNAAAVVDEEMVPAPQESRCDDEVSGAVGDRVLGIICQFCRHSKSCGEEDCKRCEEGDLNQPCIGKKDCSSCHSSNALMCHACLKVRYGEVLAEIGEVMKNTNWMCSHCIEVKVSTDSGHATVLHLLEEKIEATGPSINYHDAREQVYQSVVHLLVDSLKRQAQEV